MKKPKLNEVLYCIFGLLILFLGAVAFLFAIVSPGSLDFGFGHIYVKLQTPFTVVRVILITLFFAMCTHSILHFLKQSLQIDESKLNTQRTNIWQSIAVFTQYFDLFRSVVALLLFGGIATFFTYLIVYLLLHNHFIYSNNLLLIALTVIVYIVVGRPVVKWMGDKLTKSSLNKNNPKYIIEKDGILIDFNIKDLNYPTKKYIVKINFDEINEIKPMTQLEAQAFLRYNTGPDFNLAVRQIKDLANFLAGKITRPQVAFNNLGYPGVLIRGPELFYFMTFVNEHSNNDYSDLVQAFEKYKRQNARSL